MQQRQTTYKAGVEVACGLCTAIFAILTMLSCANEKEISTFTTSYEDFVNSLTIEGLVEPVTSTTLTSPRNCDGTVEFLVEDGEYVEEGQIVCIIIYQELQTQFDQISIDLENAEAGLNKTKADLNLQLALLEAQVKTNEADTKIAQMDSLQLAYVTSSQKAIKSLELEKASIGKARYEKKLEALKVIQQSEVKKIELQIQRLKIRVDGVKEQLDALTVKAPRSGMVIRPEHRLTRKQIQVGDPVWSNFPVAIMPDFKQMKVKITASEADFKNISVNDSVIFTFDAMPGNTGSGKILKKAPVGQPYKQGATVKFFEIEASIDQVDSMPEPGFTANCHVIMKQMENVISVPQIALFDEDSIKVVYIQRKNGFESRQVLTDVTSPTKTVITAGLSDGEDIALSKPKPSHVKIWTALPDSLFQKQDIPADTLKPDMPPNAPANPVSLPQTQSRINNSQFN